MVICQHCSTERTSDMGKIWCPCGKPWDELEARTTLRSLKFAGFTGPQSTSPRMEAFFATGDAEAFNTNRTPGDVMAEHERETRGRV